MSRVDMAQQAAEYLEVDASQVHCLHIAVEQLVHLLVAS